MEHIDKFPLAFQVIAGLGLFFGTFMLACFGWVWKKLGNKLPDMLSADDGPKNAVVLSASIADSQAIKDLAGSINRLIDRMDEDGQDQIRALGRIDHKVAELIEEQCRTTKAVKEWPGTAK